MSSRKVNLRNALDADNLMFEQHKDWGDYRSKVAELLETDKKLMPTEDRLVTPEMIAEELRKVLLLVKRRERAGA